MTAATGAAGTGMAGTGIKRIGFAGLGAMGSGMATRLIQQGYELTVYNRTAERCEPLAALGARVASDPVELADGVDAVFVSLADAGAVLNVLFGPDGDGGTASRLAPGTIVADLSTVPPDFARTLAERLTTQGLRPLDTCVLGNAQHARDGELRFMVGGPAEDLAAIRPVLDAMGKEVTHLGDNGMGATMKLVLNLIMGVQMQAMAEAVVFGERAGLPRETVLRLIAASGFSSPVMKFKAGVMQRRAFGRADFRLSLMRKDMTLVLAACQQLAVPMPVCEATYTALTAAMHQGLGELDCAAVLSYMERASGLSTQDS
jgi:3-hydroxyisobutyrate dehydrogenase